MKIASQHNVSETGISIESISVGTHQVRVGDSEGDAFDQLLLSIKTHGLLQRIGVCRSNVGEFEYECVWGQRRLAAFRQLAGADGLYSEIPAVVFEDRQDALIYKAISLAENVSQLPMTAADLTESLTTLYEKYGSYVEVERQFGISQHLVRKHVKFARLPQQLKEKVELGGLNQATAIKVADACETPGGYDAVRGNELIAEIVQLDDTGAKKLIKRAKQAPRETIGNLVGRIDEPDATTKIHLTLDNKLNGALNHYQAQQEHQTSGDAAIDLITQGLTTEGLL
jgi:ParB/RepB/Spo0J family partition protein